VLKVKRNRVEAAHIANNRATRLGLIVESVNKASNPSDLTADVDVVRTKTRTLLYHSIGVLLEGPGHRDNASGSLNEREDRSIVA